MKHTRIKMRKTILSIVLLSLFASQNLSPSLSKNDVTNFAFTSSAFLKSGFFYLATSTPGKKTFALARAFLSGGAVDVKALAPQTAVVNTVAKTANPLYNSQITHLSLVGANPVVVFDTGLKVGFTNGDDGSMVYTNVVNVKDANATPLDTKGIVGIQGSPMNIFAAVRPGHATVNTFGKTDSGIAILQRKDASLVPINATNGMVGNLAVDVITPAGVGAALNDHVAMHWDNTLKRLFVGLSVVTHADARYSLLVGRAKNGALTLESAIPTTSITLLDDTDYVVGYQAAGKTQKIYHVKTMHTSTGKAYVIVNASTFGTENPKTVFALPIVQQQYSGTAIGKPNDIGKITNKANIAQDKVAAAEGELTLATEDAAKIGGGDAHADVVQMFVHNDTVYVCCSDDTSAATQGIFKSTALFGKNGLIRAWTPWQRVMGAADQVFGAGIDLTNANFWYLTKTTNDGDTIKTTHWTKKDAMLLGSLRDHLATVFPQNTGGIHQLFNFDETTLGFAAGLFSMMVATGLGKVSLVQTGKNNGGVFEPTRNTDFTTGLATNVRTYNSQVLKDIGPICCADVSRSGPGDYLFVGGYNGVAVLSKSSGAGWTALSNVAGDLDLFSFKKIGTFKNVHKIICDELYLYVLTPSTLYRIALNANKFKDTSPDPLDAQIIAQPTYANIPTCNACDSFLDFIVSGKTGILATTSGLYRTANNNDITGVAITEAQAWTQALTDGGFNLGPVTHLFLQSLVKGKTTMGGNLYVTAGNMSTDLTAIVRFDVEDTNKDTGPEISSTSVQPITEQKEAAADPIRDYYYPFGHLRTAFVTDGTFGFNILSRHFGRTSFVRQINMHPLLYPIRLSSTTLPLELSSINHNTAIPVQNTASGAWFTPGDWGTRINE